MTHKQAEQLYRQAGVAAPPEISGTPAPSKYGAKKKELDGHMFDSSLEARAYQVLRQLESCGEITDLELQPSFVLQAAFRDRDGKKHRQITYRADFKFRQRKAVGSRDLHQFGDWAVVDIKGFATDVFRIKEKILRAKYPNLDFQIWDAKRVRELERA